jgi:outer membrane protein OmpA-like peptidoglycan-associated protein
MVVLVPDPDGKVGMVTVKNNAGERVLNKAGQSTTAGSKDSRPSAPKVLPEKEINRVFGDALAAQPPQPVHFILYNLHESVELTPESKALLPMIVQAIEEMNSVDTSVVGHTDTLGSVKYNYLLSKKRAEAVARLLIDLGVDPKILEIESHSEKNLLIPTADETREPQNRRVEVTVR